MEHPYKEHISNEEVNSLPAGAFGGEIHLVDTEEGIEAAVKILMKHELLGFDTETRPSFSRGVSYGVSLLQLSTFNRCYLFRLHRTGLTPSLCQLLSSEEITKVGAAVRDDIKGLQRLRNFTPRGFVDLQNQVQTYGIAELSLRKMAAIVVGFRLSKAQRLSNWESNTLTPAQQLYAATDAWISREIYVQLTEPKAPNPPHYLSTQP